MKNSEYESLEQIDADLSLMFENAKRYNMPNSSIYKRAFRLQQIMQVCIPIDYIKKKRVSKFKITWKCLLIPLCSLKKENFSGERKKMATVFCHPMPEASKGKGTRFILNCVFMLTTPSLIFYSHLSATRRMWKRTEWKPYLLQWPKLERRAPVDVFVISLWSNLLRKTILIITKLSLSQWTWGQLSRTFAVSVITQKML